MFQVQKDIINLVVECDICQKDKGVETVKNLGALQPFPIPLTLWIETSKDFTMGLPKAGNKSVIMMAVDQLSKYAHFCSLQHPFTPTTIAQIFLDQIFKLHGMITSILYNHDSTFTGKLWK